MYSTIKFEGVIDRILSLAVKQGLAKTKTEALRLGALELANKYKLLEREEDAEDIRDIKAADKKIASGKLKLVSEEEIWKVLKG